MSLQSRLRYVEYQIAACERKCSFPTRGKAILRAYKSGFPHNTPYRCPICNEWHLTSNKNPNYYPVTKSAKTR